ncbi:unnamed protein product [Rhizoctonia solani]|uniref:Ubiquitin-like-conjugating enzyme ATG10 n=1 Tax=Rhizoctonia solani TaxID=456999 RepID=A0A8H3BVZ1_9AGAM|nr:unnamed protein product [Rhizoctonia solani]CAE6468615.1 unnamed protein product [Rhizoctonia solani]
MEPPATLSRDEFCRACQAFLQEHPKEADGSNILHYVGFGSWNWSEHSSIPTWRYLTRTSSSKAFKIKDNAQDNTFPEDDDQLIEHDDESCVPISEDVRVYFHESIVWHPTYMVPTYYFHVADAGGSPVPLTQIVNTARFRRRTLLDMAGEVAEYGVQPTETGNAQFPLLSQGDHPITGILHWYLHPCETSVAVREILGQTLDIPWDSSNPQCLLRWFKAWLAVLTTAIDLNN